MADCNSAWFGDTGGALSIKNSAVQCLGGQICTSNRFRVNGQRTASLKEAGLCFSLTQHQPPEETRALIHDFSTICCSLCLGPFLSWLGNYYYSTKEISVIIVTSKMRLVFGDTHLEEPFN